ncbi:unnamed protein product [Bursaphelenchus xylophilus]|uniref:(pine wood nematode) hypothetical protein n=1 Tax=Bursaphelenchus xylophilus TaxID=6326 RepID=A0A1I7S3H4_BURXY|nr:unnamed protein product [Bursaphelenchus xylophilus]CAG9116312.1 unnamed protein product [Bursaphelenchus xylophilus]
MAGRGRPKRGPMPNIAAAGRTVKAEPKQEAATSSKPRGRGRGRSEDQGRGRGAAGRGVGARRGRANIIQSEAIFTAGLDEGLARTRRGDTGIERIVGKLERPDRIDDSEEGTEVKNKNGHIKAESSIPTYELEWMSDDEYDREQLSELMQDGFLSDVHRARDAPVVLPSRDTEQFVRLVRKKGTKVKDEPMDVDQSIKAEVFSQGTSEAELDRISDVGLAEAGEYFKDCIKGTAQDFLLMQLPASLSHFKNFMAKKEEDNTNATTIDTPIKAEGFENGFVKQEAYKADEKGTSSHCLDGIPSNSQIGKVQILKNGRARFIIGGKPMEIRSAIPSNLNEAIVSIDINADGESRPDSQLRYLGGVGHSLLCSYNYNRLLKPS